MRCPECKSLNVPSAAVCTSCGLILIRKSSSQARAIPVPAEPRRRAEDYAVQKRRATDIEMIPCRFCLGEIAPTAIRCRHCSEIVNDEFYRDRARRVRSCRQT